MVLYRAMKKYGKENFTIEEIDVANDQNELNKLEGFYIEKYNSILPNGYNSIHIINGKGKNSKLMNEKISKSNQGLKKHKKPGYIGVINTKSNTYMARITKDQKCVSLGNFNTIIEAAQAYDIAAIKLFGDCAILNFPELKNEYLNNNIKTKPNKHNVFGRKHSKVRKDKKSNINITGIYFSNSQQRWIVKKTGVKRKTFKNKEDAIKYLENSLLNNKIHSPGL